MLTRAIPLKLWTATPAINAIRVPPLANERVDGSESLAPVDRLGRPLQECRRQRAPRSDRVGLAQTFKPLLRIARRRAVR